LWPATLDFHGTEIPYHDSFVSEVLAIEGQSVFQVVQDLHVSASLTGSGSPIDGGATSPRRAPSRHATIDAMMGWRMKRKVIGPDGRSSRFRQMR
jgi:hypothetical protein